jgi:hypothetical protein
MIASQMIASNPDGSDKNSVANPTGRTPPAASVGAWRCRASISTTISSSRCIRVHRTYCCHSGRDQRGMNSRPVLLAGYCPRACPSCAHGREPRCRSAERTSLCSRRSALAVAACTHATRLQSLSLPQPLHTRCEAHNGDGPFKLNARHCPVAVPHMRQGSFCPVDVLCEPLYFHSLSHSARPTSIVCP